MQISIIIPTYNEAENIAGLITHLQGTATPHIDEIIVVDGGSEDDTISVAGKLGVKVVRCPSKGRAAQMNYGASLSKGEVLYFVHADTKPPGTFSSDITAAVQQGFSLGRYRTKFLSKKWLLRFNEWATRFDLFICMGGDQTLFIKTELFTKLGGFKEDMILMEEYDLCRRARETGRYKIMGGAALVSARKYDKNSWWQVQMANYKVVQLYKKGTPQQVLAATYKKMLNW